MKQIMHEKDEVRLVNYPENDRCNTINDFSTNTILIKQLNITTAELARRNPLWSEETNLKSIYSEKEMGIMNLRYLCQIFYGKIHECQVIPLK